MTFRVITGNTYQGGGQAGGKGEGDKPKDLMPRPSELQTRPQTPVISGPTDLGPVAQLLDRLEALSFTFEALNAGSRTYAAEAVLETLARMERRDLQALAAIEAFASALKTVSQHLAGLRNAVQSTAHETAAGLEHIAERLNRLESQAGIGGGDHGVALDGIAERLANIEARVAEPVVAEPFDPSPLSDMLDTIARRVSRIEKKVGEIPTDRPGESFDPIPITTLLETIARRLSRVERKVEQGGGPDLAPITTAIETVARRVSRMERKVEEQSAAAPATDAAPINAALETIARRVSRIEKKMDQPTPLPTLELDAGPINEALDGIAQRVAEMERKVDAGADGASIASCLLAVAERLSRIEVGFGLGGGQSSTAQPESQPTGQALVVTEPAAAALPAAECRPPVDEPAQLVLAEPPAAPSPDATDATTVPTPERPAAAAPAATQPAADEAAGARQRVDLLLEQVFRVLSR